MTIWPVPSGLPHTKEGSILIAEGPVAFSPASSPALILALTCISCSWLSLKGKSVSSTCKTGETLSGARSRVESRFVESARSSEPHCVLTCCLCEAKRWATAVTKAAPLLLPLSERQNLTSHSGISRPKTFRRRLEYLKWGQCRVQFPLAFFCSSQKKKSLTLCSIHTTATTSYCGCVLYTVPSTPTVIFSSFSLRLVLIRVKIADRPAATRLDDLKDTMVLTCWTATQSSSDGLKPSQVRMSLVFSRPVLYLKMKRRGFYERMWTWMCGIWELCNLCT